MYKDLLQRYKVAKISFLNLSQNMVTFSVIPVSANNDLHTGNNGLLKSYIVTKFYFVSTKNFYG